MLNTQTNSKLKFTKIGLLLFFVSLDIFYNCTTSIKPQAFTYYKKPIEGKIPFRMDGYYYCKSCSKNETYSSFYFFYPDGFILKGYYRVQNKTLPNIDAHLDSIFHIWKTRKNTVNDRGAFMVNKDTLEMQFFSCTLYCDIVNQKMKILNDSILLKDYKDYELNSICDTFHFRKLNWKPDSTYQIGFEKQLKKGKQW